MRMFTSCLDGSLYCYQITAAEIELEGKAVTVYGIHIYKDGCKHSHRLSESCLIDDVSDELDYVERLARYLAENGAMPPHAEQLISEFLCEYPSSVPEWS